MRGVTSALTTGNILNEARPNSSTSNSDLPWRLSCLVVDDVLLLLARGCLCHCCIGCNLNDRRGFALGDTIVITNRW